jgi:universal stress protein A
MLTPPQDDTTAATLRPESSADLEAETESIQSPLKLKKILVPTDFSAPAVKAFRYALALARQFKARVTLLHVPWTPNYSGVPEAAPYAFSTLEDTQYFREEAIQQANKQFLTAGAELQEAGVKYDTAVVFGTPYESIVQFAGENAIDLVVIATHGYTGLKHVFLGSTTERVVRHAPCPVLVVREQEHDFLPNAPQGN